MTTEKLTPRDFVFCGIRANDKGAPFISIRLLVDDEIQAKEMFFGYTAKQHRRLSVGQVYRGASFSETQALNIGSVNWLRKWENREDCLEWEARETAAQERRAHLKLESDATAMSEMQKLLLPLRRRYSALRNRYDMAGASALELAILTALRTPVRATEKEKS